MSDSIWYNNVLLGEISYPAGNYMFKVNNRNTITRCKTCSKLTRKTPERRHWPRSGVFIVNFEHISHISSLSVFAVKFERVNTSWVSEKQAVWISIWLFPKTMALQQWNPFPTNVLLLYPLKTSKNRRFSVVFRGYRSGTLVENGLRKRNT